MAMRCIAKRARRCPKACRRTRRQAFGGPADWEAALRVAYAARRRASERLDDVPHRRRRPSYPTGRLRDLYGSLSTLLGCLIPLRRSSSSEPILSFAGNKVVCEVFPGGSAGSLHDSALGLRPPKVLGAFADGYPPCNQRCGIASATDSAWDVFSAYAEPVCLVMFVYAAASFCGQRNVSPVISMRCRITASLRANATQAFLWLVRFFTRRAQSFSGWALRTTVNRLLAAS